MRNSVFISLVLASAMQALGLSACSNSAGSSNGAGGGAGGSSSVGGTGAASATTGVCADTCLKDCASDTNCNQSAGEMCCDYGPDGKACVPATQCPRYCSDDSKCNVPSGEACMMTVEASSQLVCTKPANALRTCSDNTGCATNETCCTIYKTPVCLATNLCPAACSSSSDCNGAANEVCCTSLPTVDKTLAVSGLCVDTRKVACPKLCGTSTDCNRSAGESCCDGRCSTTCVKTCTTSADCSGQLCCKTKAQNSPFRTAQTLGYAASTGGSANGGTTSTGGTKATGGTTGISTTGGTKATGGTAGTSTTGGTKATGGSTVASPTGGKSSTGGASPTGGASLTGGTPSSGGANNSGGTTALTASGGSSTGGTPATGGTLPTGGTSLTGGNPSSGGANNSGGTTALTASGGSDTGGTPATGGTASKCDSLMLPTASGSLNISAGIVTVGTLQGQAFATTVNGSNTTTCITPKCDGMGVCDPPWGQTALCAAGMVTADSTSSSMAVFGFNLNQLGSGTPGTVAAPPNMNVSVVKGTSAGDTAARIVLVDGNGISYCVDAGQWSSGSTIPIGRFSTNCWNTSQPGPALSSGARLVSIEVEIPSAVATDRPFDICLTNVKIN